jgi:hypothetical protein
VPTLLADANIQGHVDRLINRMKGDPWVEFWTHLQLSYATFANVGLDPSDSDIVVWNRCQEKQLCLVTNNRNSDGPDSLETTIRTCNTPQCLPVFTIGDADRTLSDRGYSDAVIWALIDYLLRLDGLLGTGRLYLPARTQ